VLYRVAKEVGATKIALGHHVDDFIETLLLNLFFAGALKAMPAKLLSDDAQHVVIRPLVYVGEDEARAYAKESELPIIGCCCPACGDLGLQRQRAKKLIMDLEIEHPGVGNRCSRPSPTSRPGIRSTRGSNPLAELRAHMAEGHWLEGRKGEEAGWEEKERSFLPSSPSSAPPAYREAVQRSRQARTR
jgi:tRNA 2-thiocytidine biosynthesis protein TtcA